MAGTRSGGIKQRETVYAKYGQNYFVNLGFLGGSAEHTKPRGFACNRELAAIAGAKGGRISKRRSKGEVYASRTTA